MRRLHSSKTCFEGNYAHDICCPCGIRKHLCSQLKTLILLTLNAWTGFSGSAYFHRSARPAQPALSLSSRWSETRALILLTLKLREPQRKGSAFKGKRCEYFHTPVKAVIIKHWGDQLQTLILLTLKRSGPFFGAAVRKTVHSISIFQFRFS